MGTRKQQTRLREDGTACETERNLTVADFPEKGVAGLTAPFAACIFTGLMVGRVRP